MINLESLVCIKGLPVLDNHENKSCVKVCTVDRDLKNP